ncbi:MAG: serine/threonine transporter SstT [Alphaproteobacteria bacterium]|nr:serine/threonine transporter SstT [Alphaproteobacteria bacterium]
MKKFFEFWDHTSLVFRIAIGVVLGVCFALYIPQLKFVSAFGKIFVGLLKSIAPVLVFVLVISSLTNAKGKIGKRFRIVICLYMASTFLAALLAVVACRLFPITIKLVNVSSTSNPPSGISVVLTNILTGIATNPIVAIMNSSYLAILFWAVVFGLALKSLASSSTCQIFTDVSSAVSKVVSWIIQLAPLGIMGLVFDAVLDNGLSIFSDYGKLLAVLVGTMILMALVIDPLIEFIVLRKNPYPLVFKCLSESGLTAFFTRSSAANIPVNIKLCEELGLDKDFYSVSIPLGATINMDGAAITITVMALTMATTLGIQVDFCSALILSLLATVGACGAAGVAGGSILLIPMACSLFGISEDLAMQAVAVGFIIGVVQDSCETAINSAGDVMFTAAADYYEKSKLKEIENL